MALTTRDKDFSAWYNELVQQADLAENSDVRGCMVIKPYGYAVWEKMQEILDKMFKATGHRNAYFPLFIPKSYLSKEASHVEGFAKECAVVTHYRLKNSPDGKGVIVDPEAKLEEELIVRPTSETIIWSTYKNWIHSYRDLPLLINQWANVVRWEMRTRLFLRTAEFLWQEGHTAHASKEEAISEAEQMLGVYHDFLTNIMAIDPVLGRKTANERFAGADDTYCLEAFMQDGKALQAGTSHFLGQNFAKAFDVQFTNKDNKQEYVWATSRGVSTRLMGALILSHSDDKGLVIPPALAPVHVVIVPICKKEDELEELMKHIDPLLRNLKGKTFTIHSKILGDIQIPINIKVDDDLSKGIGRKYTQHELQGVPLIIAFGKKDIEKKSLEWLHRDIEKGLSLEGITYIPGHKNTVTYDGNEEYGKSLAQLAIDKLEQIQTNLLTYNKKLREENTVSVDTYEEFKKALDDNKFVMAHWDSTTETELKIKEETKATIRCIPLDNPQENGKCILTGKPSTQRVLFARAY